MLILLSSNCFAYLYNTPYRGVLKLTINNGNPFRISGIQESGVFHLCKNIEFSSDFSLISFAVAESINGNKIYSYNPIISFISLVSSLKTQNFIFFLPQIVGNYKLNLYTFKICKGYLKGYAGFNTDYFTKGIYSETVYGIEYMKEPLAIAFEFKQPLINNIINDSYNKGIRLSLLWYGDFGQ